MTDILPAAVHVVARVTTPGGSTRLLLPGHTFIAVIHGRRVAQYRQRYTYLGQMDTDDTGRHWILATRNGHQEWVALDAVIRVHRRLP